MKKAGKTKGMKSNAWDGGAAEKGLLDYARDDKGEIQKSKIEKYFGRVDGDGKTRADYHYPIGKISSGKPVYDEDGLHAAYNAASGAHTGKGEPEVAKKIAGIIKREFPDSMTKGPKEELKSNRSAEHDAAFHDSVMADMSIPINIKDKHKKIAHAAATSAGKLKAGQVPEEEDTQADEDAESPEEQSAESYADDETPIDDRSSGEQAIEGLKKLKKNAKDTRVEFLLSSIDDEQEAIDDYTKALAACKDPAMKKAISQALGDEKSHNKMFEALLNKIDPKALEAHEGTESEEEESSEDDEAVDVKKNMKVNASQVGGKVLFSDSNTTVIPVVLMKELVTNGALKPFEEFSKDAHWLEGQPIIPPHKQGDSPVNHLTPKPGKLRNIKINEEMRRVEGEAVLFNDRIAPSDLERIKNGEQFAGSIGYFSNEEKLSEPQVWKDGTKYNSIERGPFYFDHFSMVPAGACPLPECGFNVNSKSSIIQTGKIMTDIDQGSKESPLDAKAEDIKANAEVPKVPKEEPKVGNEVELKINALLERMDKLEKENADLVKDKEIRMNAEQTAEMEIFANSVRYGLNANAQIDWDKTHKAEFAKDPLAWLKKNITLFKGYEKMTVQPPIGAPFVPQVNADEEKQEEQAAIETFKKVVK